MHPDRPRHHHPPEDPGLKPFRGRIPKSLKDLTPGQHFDPKSFFHEMVWKPFKTPRTGTTKLATYPSLREDQLALTWIGHASFLVQFPQLNVLIDPNFGNWIFLLKRLKRPGLRLRDLPPIDLVLLSHAHFDHFHKGTLRRLPPSKIGVMPWGMGKLAKRLGFQRIIELKWWESFGFGDLKVTLTPGKHWGARTLHDIQRGWGGFLLEYRGRRVYHAGDTAYFEGFKEIGRRLEPELALLPIGAYYPDSFRRVHMGPDEAVRAFHDLGADWFVPMHYGTFKLSFESLEEPPRWLREIVDEQRIGGKVRILEEGVPEKF